jgi:hypothetical protein
LHKKQELIEKRLSGAEARDLLAYSARLKVVPLLMHPVSGKRLVWFPGLRSETWGTPARELEMAV